MAQTEQVLDAREQREVVVFAGHVDAAGLDVLAYPISTFTYCIGPNAAPQKQALAQWIYYAMTGGQAFGAGLDFAPIPKVVLNAGIKSVRELQK